MKKWKLAELVTLDIDMTAGGNNKNRTEGKDGPGNSEKNGRPQNNQSPAEIIDEIIDDFKSDVTNEYS